MRRHLLNQAGDTLVEVAMAISILSVILVTAYSVANTSAETGLQARERTEATQLAQSQAELLRSWRDYDVSNSIPLSGFFNALQSNCQAGAGCTISETYNPLTNSSSFQAAPSGLAVTNGLYHIQVVSSVSGVPVNRVDNKIIIEWASNRGDWNTADGNTTEVDFTLVDTSNYNPLDCSSDEEECL
jgi:Tfp pilus assembly protein PilV